MGVIEDRTSILLIMEYLPCGSLQSTPPQLLLSRLEIIEQCLEGLKYLHSRGVTHRDIKPDNIVLQSIMPVQVKIIDFGLATTRHQSEFCGNMPYCAPEMWRGQQYFPTVDIWALGITVLEIGNNGLTEIVERTFSSDVIDHEGYFQAIAELLPGTRRAYSTLLYRMLDENPRTRYTAELCLKMMADVRSESKRANQEEDQ